MCRKNDNEYYGEVMKVIFGILLFTTLAISDAHAAGIPVFDASNTAQSTIAAVESINQTMKQIEQHTLQLRQFEDQLLNSTAPAAYVWDQAQGTMRKILSLQNQLDFYTQQAGGMENYLQRFGDVNTYRNSPQFGPVSRENEALGSAAQKRANDNRTRVLEQQQGALREDAANLERLQSGAQSAKGRLEAIQAANQFASHQSNQLLQIRALLMAQQEAENARAQTIADREARSQAIHEKATSGEFKESSKRGW